MFYDFKIFTPISETEKTLKCPPPPLYSLNIIQIEYNPKIKLFINYEILPITYIIISVRGQVDNKRDYHEFVNKSINLNSHYQCLHSTVCREVDTEEGPRPSAWQYDVQ